MATSDEQSGRHRGKVREELVNEAIERVAIRRADVLREQMLSGTVSREGAMRLQEACLVAYFALRPLRNHEAVEDWWDEVQLSEHWVDDRYTTTEQRVLGDIETGVKIVEEDVENVDYVTGLGRLEDIREQTETVTQTRSGMMGQRDETFERPKLLNVEILVDIASTLEDAAEKLGFGPELPVDREDASLTDNPVDPGGRFRDE